MFIFLVNVQGLLGELNLLYAIIDTIIHITPRGVEPNSQGWWGELCLLYPTHTNKIKKI